jgi:aminoglycoside phosphotransferase (APT) family kinase protein
VTDDDELLVPVRPGDELDWTALEAHLRFHLELPAGEMRVRQFSAGHANLTYLLAFGDRSLVFRRPPRGTLAPGAHDMAREHKVLSRLWRVYPRAPRSDHYCDDESIVGAPFVIIEYREGEVVRATVPSSMAEHPDVERRICLALVDAMAELHAVDVDAADLSDLGTPDGFGARQVSGWHDRWRRAAPDDPVPAMNDVAAELAASVPEPPRVSVVHNDLKLDNCQFDAGDPDRVTSVFDWDMATTGDPLFDVANLLSSSQSSPIWVVSRDDVAERYAARSGIDITNIKWYEAFASFRTGVVVQQLSNRYARGESTDERLASFGDLVPGIAERARALVDETRAASPAS